MQIRTSDSLAGIAIKDVRDFLRRFTEVVRPADLTSEFGSRAGHKLLSALVAEGYLELSDRGADSLTLTDKALRLRKAGAGRAISHSTAERLLQEFLVRAEEVERNPRYLYRVKRAVVFGSFLCPGTKDRFGDVDIAVESQRKHDSKTFQALKEQREVSGDCPSYAHRNISCWVCWPSLEVMHFLKSRSRLDLLEYDPDFMARVSPQREIFADGRRTS